MTGSRLGYTTALGRSALLRSAGQSRTVIVVFANEVTVEREPETTFLQERTIDNNEVMLVEANGALVPFALTTIEPLPSQQVALIADDQLPQTFVPADVSFIGQVVSLVGNLVTFLLPDGTTRTLLDGGLLPAIGSQDVVVENGQQLVTIAPAVTNFVGQVVAADNGVASFALPNGTMRTLMVAEPVPAPGTRVVVVENGPRVVRLEPVL